MDAVADVSVPDASPPDAAVPQDICDRLGLSRAAFQSDSTGSAFGEIAGDFTVDELGRMLDEDDETASNAETEKQWARLDDLIPDLGAFGIGDDWHADFGPGGGGGAAAGPAWAI